MSGKGRGIAGGHDPPAPAKMKLRKIGGRIARFFCSWCAYSTISPTVVEQHEEKEHT